MSCLKHLPFLFSAAFLVLLLGLKAELESGNARGDCWSAIIHFPLVKVINWGWKSLHMDGHNLFSWKGFPLVNWKMIISLEAAGKTSSLPKSQLSIPPKKRVFYNYLLMFLPFEANDCFLFFQCLPRSRWFVWQTVASLLKDIWDLIRLAPDSRSFARSMEVRRPPFYCLAC